MGTVLIVAIVFGSLLTLAALVCGTIFMIVKTRSNRIVEGKSKTEEAMIIQEIYQGLDRMEKRIESLETILMDAKKKEQ